MKAKTKTKSKITKTKIVKAKKTERTFHVSYLALAIVALVLLEGLLFSFASAADWKEGVKVLDVHPAVVQGVDDFEITLSPVAETVNMVNQFYSLATDAAIELLDLRGGEKGMVEFYSGVSQFYMMASVEMETLLGLNTINPVWAAGQ